MAFEFGRLGIFFSFLSFWRFFDFSPGHGYGLHEEPPQRRRDWNGCELVSNYLRYRGRKRWTHSRRTQDYKRIKCVHKMDEDSIKGRHRGLKPEIITGDPKLEAVSSGYTKDHSGASTSVARADDKTVGDHRTNGTGAQAGKHHWRLQKHQTVSSGNTKDHNAAVFIQRQTFLPMLLPVTSLVADL